jgi:hypothetical protein
MARHKARRLPPSWRLMLMMPLAAWSVHQLRYLLAYGAGTGRALSEQGHAYLTPLTPAVVALAALAFGGILVRFARAWSDGVADRDSEHRTLRLWVVTVVGLLAIYAGQELAEGALAGGHDQGLAAVFGNGGWLVLPVSLVVGGLVALCLRGVHVAELLIARHRALAACRDESPSRPSYPPAPLRRSSPLATQGAGRAPPARTATAH